MLMKSIQTVCTSVRDFIPYSITLPFLKTHLVLVAVSWKKLNFNILHCLVVSHSTFACFLTLNKQMSSKEYTHLNNLSQLRFVVVDEADRMIKQGNFPQLQQIFEVINQANTPPPDDNSDDESDSEDDDDDDKDGYDRMKSLAGIRGEAKVVMLSDSILEAIERERAGGGSVGVKGGTPKPMEMDDDEYDEQAMRLLQNDDDTDLEEEVEPVHRQTFVYSATLTLPPSMHHLIKKDPSSKKKKGKGRKGQPTTVDGAISEILDVAGARGEIKIVDLSNTIPEGKKSKSKKTDSSSSQDNNTTKNGSSKAANNRRLPAGLTLGEIPCAQRHKDSHLYAYLVTTRQGSSGPCLVFCNSIAAVRRVGETLKMLGLPVKMLHAQMPQVSIVSILLRSLICLCMFLVVTKKIKPENPLASQAKMCTMSMDQMSI